MTIGKDLPKLLDDITELILAESDVIKIDQLRAKQKDIAIELQKLIDGNVDKATPEYNEVIVGIKVAHDAVKEAIKDLGKVAETINKIAKVLSLLSKVVSMVA
ncbi:MAG: hypothetical protein JRD93_14715 [Deltaproteobacteria bacterium]|nr:hypothetical protein [Deltaproteobacteria bacterium]